MYILKPAIVAPLLSTGLVMVPATHAFPSESGCSSSAQGTSTYSSDYSNERWSRLWEQVGPVSSMPITTTVIPTPEPSQARPPFNLQGSFAAGNQSTAKFPKGFLWGTSTSSYQVEGAVKADGRGPSIWDLLSHRVPDWVQNGDTGDVADLFYYLYPQDIELMKSFDMPALYFSIAWPRIFPFGRGPVNEAGLSHYDDLFERLAKAGIRPVVSLYHWDIPMALMNEYNGWVSPRIVDDFLAYAKTVMSRWDKYNPVWFTLNEPQAFCRSNGYEAFPSGYWPDYNITGTRAVYYCGHYSLLSHAAVVDWYRNEFKGRGRVSFKNGGKYYFGNSSSSEDAAAVSRANDFLLGWFNDPVWRTGDYPKSMRNTLGDMLPQFTPEQRAQIKGSCDFIGLDDYTSAVVGMVPGGTYSCANNASHPAWPQCVQQAQVDASGWDIGFPSQAGWLKGVPIGMRRLLNYVQQTYTGPKSKDIMVTEFGFPQPYQDKFTSMADRRYDLGRMTYFTQYLQEILTAYTEDHVNISGCLSWALYDNFEWRGGYGTRFGLQTVNYTTLERYPEASMFTFTDFFKQHVMS